MLQIAFPLPSLKKVCTSSMHHLNVLGKDELFSPHPEGKICPDSNVSMMCTGALSFPPVLSSETGTGMVTRCLQADAFVLKQSWGQQGEDPKERWITQRFKRDPVSLWFFCFVFFSFSFKLIFK